MALPGISDYYIILHLSYILKEAEKI